MNRCIDRHLNGRVDRWMDGQMEGEDGQAQRWICGWKHTCMNIYVYIFINDALMDDGCMDRGE